MSGGDIVVPIRSDDKQLTKGLKSSKAKIKAFGRDVRRSANDFTKYSAVASAAMITTTAAIVAMRSQSIDALAKTADALGLTTQKLQALNHIAELNGVSSESMSKGIRKMERGLGEAARKGGTTADALRDAGLSIKELINLSPDEQIQKLADAMGNVENQSIRTSIASDIFGRDGINMLKVLTQLRKDGVEPTAKELAKMGVAITRIDAAKVEAANDAFFKAKQVVEGVANTLAVELAPFIEEVSNRFVDAAKESDGFGDSVERGIKKALVGAGKFADFLQGVRVSFKAVSVVATGFSAAAITAFQLAAEAAVAFMDVSTRASNSVVDALNQIPGVEIAKSDLLTDSDFMKGLRNLGETARNEVGIARTELHNLAMQKLPSDQVEEFLNAVIEKSNEAAEKVTKVQKSLIGGGATSADSSEGDDFKKRIKAIQDRFVTEQEANRQHAALMLEIEQGRKEGLIASDKEYYSIKIQAETEHAARLKDIAEKTKAATSRLTAAEWAGKISTIAGAMQSINNATEANDKKGFERKKKLSMATALASLPSAVIQSFQNAGGYPWGLVPAGAMLATGLKQISNIKKQTFGGGGSQSSSLSAGGSSAGSSAQQGGGGGGQSQAGTITVQGLSGGSLFDGETVRELSERLDEHRRNGGDVRFAA